MTHTLDELEKLLRLATTRPWKANTADKTGEDWLICSLGNSNEDSQDWIVTTDRIRASELDGDAKFDAALIVAAINALPGLLESARRVERLEAALKPFAEARLVSWGQRTQGVGDFLTSVWINTDPNKAVAEARAALKGT